MNTVVVKQGKDSKLYPAEPLTREQRNRARWLAHNLVHRDGMTIRAAQQVMLSNYALRRSVGQIWKDLQRFECPSCADRAPDPAPQPQESPPAAVHHRPGGLTDMLADG